MERGVQESEGGGETCEEGGEGKREGHEVGGLNLLR